MRQAAGRVLRRRRDRRRRRTRRSARATPPPTRSSAPCSRRCPRRTSSSTSSRPSRRRRRARARARRRARRPARARGAQRHASLSVDSGTELSLHLKLPGDLSLEEAHAIAEQVERAIERRGARGRRRCRRTSSRSARRRRAPRSPATPRRVRRIVRDELGVDPARAALRRHRRGARRLPDAAARARTRSPTRTRDASRIEELIRARAAGDRRRRRAHRATMKLCMFSPRDQDLERGWPGRIDGDKVIQLAAQTLQAFFTGGGDGARARRVSARRRRLPRAGAPPAVGADLRRRRRLRVRESGCDQGATARIRACRAPSRSERVGGDHRRRRRDRRLHAARRVGRAAAARREAARLRAHARPVS